MTPNPYPFVNVTSPPAPAPPTRKMVMGVEVCTVCDLAVQFCRGHEAPTTTTAQDGAAAASLDLRIKDAQGSAMLIRPTDPWVLFCGFCGQPMATCRGECTCKGV